MQNNNPPTPQNISRPGSRNHLNTINLSNLVTSSHSVTPITSSIATTHYQNNNQPINLISTGLNGNLTNLNLSLNNLNTTNNTLNTNNANQVLNALTSTNSNFISHNIPTVVSSAPTTGIHNTTVTTLNRLANINLIPTSSHVTQTSIHQPQQQHHQNHSHNAGTTTQTVKIPASLISNLLNNNSNNNDLNLNLNGLGNQNSIQLTASNLTELQNILNQNSNSQTQNLISSTHDNIILSNQGDGGHQASHSQNHNFNSFNNNTNNSNTNTIQSLQLPSGLIILQNNNNNNNSNTQITNSSLNHGHQNQSTNLSKINNLTKISNQTKTRDHAINKIVLNSLSDLGKYQPSPGNKVIKVSNHQNQTTLTQNLLKQLNSNCLQINNGRIVTSSQAKLNSSNNHQNQQNQQITQTLASISLADLQKLEELNQEQQKKAELTQQIIQNLQQQQQSNMTASQLKQILNWNTDQKDLAWTVNNANGHQGDVSETTGNNLVNLSGDMHAINIPNGVGEIVKPQIIPNLPNNPELYSTTVSQKFNKKDNSKPKKSRKQPITQKFTKPTPISYSTDVSKLVPKTKKVNLDNNYTIISNDNNSKRLKGVGKIENITFAKPEIIKTYTQEEENLLKNMTDVAFKQKIERKGVGDWRRRYSDFNRFTSKKDFKIRGSDDTALDLLDKQLIESMPVLCNAVKRINMVRNLAMKSSSNLNLTYARLERIRQVLTNYSHNRNQQDSIKFLKNFENSRSNTIEAKSGLVLQTFPPKEIKLNNQGLNIPTFHNNDKILPNCSEEVRKVSFTKYKKNVTVLDSNLMFQRYPLPGSVVASKSSGVNSKSKQLKLSKNSSKSTTVSSNSQKKASKNHVSNLESQKNSNKSNSNSKNLEKSSNSSAFHIPPENIYSDPTSHHNFHPQNQSNYNTHINTDYLYADNIHIDQNLLKPQPLRSARLKIKQETAQAALAASQAADEHLIQKAIKQSEKEKVEPLDMYLIKQPCLLMEKYQMTNLNHNKIEEKLVQVMQEQMQETDKATGLDYNLLDAALPQQLILGKNNILSKQTSETVLRVQELLINSQNAIKKSNLEEAKKITHQSRIFKMLEKSNIDIYKFIDCIDLLAHQFKKSVENLLEISGEANFEPAGSSRIVELEGDLVPSGIQKKSSSKKSKIETLDQTPEKSGSKIIAKIPDKNLNSDEFLKLASNYDSYQKILNVWSKPNLIRSMVYAKKGCERKVQRWGTLPSSYDPYFNHIYFKNVNLGSNYQFANFETGAGGPNFATHGGKNSSKNGDSDKHDKNNNYLCRSVMQRLERENVEFTKKLYNLTWSAIEVRQEVLLRQQQECHENSLKSRSTRTRKGTKRKN